MRSLIANRKRLLGVDIGSAVVKVLELSRNNGRYRVESCALEPLPPDAVVERQFNDVERVGEALRRARARLGSRRRRVAVAVGGPAVIAKRVTLDAALTDTGILARIVGDAGHYIPFPLDEVAIDFEVLGLSERQPDQVDVLLVACRRRSIDDLRAALFAAGFRPDVVEPQSQAVERVFRLFAPAIERQVGELVVALADIGASLATLWVLVDGRAVFSREQTMGGEQLVASNLVKNVEAASLLAGEAEAPPHLVPISQRQAASVDASGSMAASAGTDPPLAGVNSRQGLRPDARRADAGGSGKRNATHDERTVLGGVALVEEIVRSLYRSLRYFYSSTHYSDIDRLLLIGDMASVPGMAEALQDALAVPVAVANPFAAMSLSPGVDSVLSKNGPALALCCGLAIRSFA